MNSENLYRFSALVVFLIGAGISIYHRSKADRETGERISPRAEGLSLMIVLRLAGLALWGGILAYLINPVWMAWAQVPLPGWLRWLGLGLGAFADVLMYWVFSNLGNNVSPTVATRKEHQLVTSGPYRFVRHPLYSVGLLSVLSMALVAANWFIAVMAVISFPLLVIRLPQEEANLIARFGNDYLEYMRTTGAFLPRLPRRERARPQITN